MTEGIVALIWAAVSSWFFFDSGMQEVGATSGAAPIVVNSVSKAWLGVVGGVLAVLGVIAAPITSGDTAFRSARLIIADFVHLDQKPQLNRLVVSVPVFAISALLLWFNISNEDGFNIIWRYFGLANQSLACFVLWAATAYLMKHEKKRHHDLITAIPACFMTSVCVSFLCIDKIGFHMPASLTPWIAVIVFVWSWMLFVVIKHRSALKSWRSRRKTK